MHQVTLVNTTALSTSSCTFPVTVIISVLKIFATAAVFNLFQSSLPFHSLHHLTFSKPSLFNKNQQYSLYKESSTLSLIENSINELMIIPLCQAL